MGLKPIQVSKRQSFIVASMHDQNSQKNLDRVVKRSLAPLPAVVVTQAFQVYRHWNGVVLPTNYANDLLTRHDISHTQIKRIIILQKVCLKLNHLTSESCTTI